MPFAENRRMKRVILALAAGAAGLLSACDSSDAPNSSLPPAPPESGSVGAPNLIVDAKALQGSVQFDQLDFEDSDCAVTEGCVMGSGTRRLLRFDANIINI